MHNPHPKNYRKEDEDMADLKKSTRIKREKNRLLKRYKALPKDSMDIIQGLIDRAAYMRISLEIMEIDLDENGFTEPFSQSDKVEPYDRERPIARLYNALVKNYQTVTKQLDDKLPKIELPPVDDGFDSFVAKREEY